MWTHRWQSQPGLCQHNFHRWILKIKWEMENKVSLWYSYVFLYWRYPQEHWKDHNQIDPFEHQNIWENIELWFNLVKFTWSGVVKNLHVVCMFKIITYVRSHSVWAKQYFWKEITRIHLRLLIFQSWNVITWMMVCKLPLISWLSLRSRFLLGLVVRQQLLALKTLTTHSPLF